MSWRGRLKRTLFGEGADRPLESLPPAADGGEAADLAESWQAPGGEAVLQELVREVVRLSEGRLPPEEIDADAHLLDHGYVDSLTAVNLLAFVQERFGVAIPDVELVGQLSSLRALADHIARESAKGGT